MSKIILSLSASVLVLITGCSDSKTSSKDVLADSSTVNTSVLPEVSSTPATSSPAVQSTASPSVTPGVNTMPAPTVSSSTPTGSGLNPAHGQPGHVCGIPVGSPLNSKPSTVSATPSVIPAPTTTTTTPNYTVTPVNTPKTKTPPGMNPPHGEPGHVCGIPVGSPLNAKPAATVSNTPEVAKPDSAKN